jgi:hypothetical protein
MPQLLYQYCRNIQEDGQLLARIHVPCIFTENKRMAKSTMTKQGVPDKKYD